MLEKFDIKAQNKIAYLKNDDGKYYEIIMQNKVTYATQFVQNYVFCFGKVLFSNVKTLTYHAANWSAPSIVYGYWDVGKGYIGGLRPEKVKFNYVWFQIFKMISSTPGNIHINSHIMLT